MSNRLIDLDDDLLISRVILVHDYEDYIVLRRRFVSQHYDLRHLGLFLHYNMKIMSIRNLSLEIKESKFR